MKIIILLIISLTSPIWCNPSDAIKYAHLGDWNLMHKSMLIEQLVSSDTKFPMEYHDTVLCLAYYYYKQGDMMEMQFWLDHLSTYIEFQCQ